VPRSDHASKNNRRVPATEKYPCNSTRTGVVPDLEGWLGIGLEIRKSVFPQTNPIKILKTKDKLHESDFEKPEGTFVSMLIAHSLRPENEKSENAERSEPNYGKLRTSRAAVQARVKNDNYRTNPAGDRKQTTATPANPGPSQPLNFDPYLITAYFTSQYYKDAMLGRVSES
jgi:hypothetical protein